MRHLIIASVLAALTTPALAQTEKETSCGHQADVVAAIQQARLDRVAERKLPDALATGATWPEKYNNIIPLLAPHIYEIKRSDLRSQDLATWWREQCLAQ